MSVNVIERILVRLFESMSWPVLEGYVVSWTMAACKACQPSPDPFADNALMDSALEQLMRTWGKVVLTTRCAFSEFINTFVGGRLPAARGRCRDVLPLPVFHARDVFHWKPTIAMDLAVLLLNICCGSLNFLFFGGSTKCVPRVATALHKGVARRVCDMLSRSLGELQLADRAPDIQGAFGRLCEHGGKKNYPALRINDIDFLARSGGVDPLPYAPKHVQDILKHPDLLYPNGVASNTSIRTSSDAHPGDRTSHVINGLRSGKLRLMRRPAASADVFNIEKADSQKLREIWNGSALSDLACRPDKPLLQANPAALANLEGSDDLPLYLSCRDAKVCFDQLLVPAELQPYFGLPSVRGVDLLTPPCCESGGIAADGLLLII
jgi:hypothetical protein